MSLDGSSGFPKRKIFAGRENSLPTYEEATEKAPQKEFIEVLHNALTIVADTQHYNGSNERIINSNNSYAEPTRPQVSPSRGLQRPLQRPAMVHHRIYRVWSTDQPTTADRTESRQEQKQDMLGFHIVSFVIGIMILLVLIVLIVKLAQKWVTVE